MPRVLIVEDSPTQAQHLALILEDAGFEVATAPDAERGFEHLVQGQFDAVLSDLLLPGDSGFDLCRRVKADPRLRHLPIVVCTSQADPVNVLRGLQAGADGFITKTRQPDELTACVRRALSRAPTTQPDEPIRVAFLNQEFELTAGRQQLLDILVSAFEDVVDLNTQYQASLVAQRELNRQLEERNQQLQHLADSERQAHENLKRAESQLIQTEKLSALGQMVAGVAHEINNPLAFVRNNNAILQRDLKHLLDLLSLYQQAEAVLDEHHPALLQRIRELADEVDLDYTLRNLQGLVARAGEGLKRIEQIVKNLRDFARLDESDLKEVDLNASIESTILLVRSRAERAGVELELKLDPLPPLMCHSAKINQVVFNLLTNAIDACSGIDAGKVTVHTRQTPDGVEIHVRDTGCGIDPAIRDKIFDPFFTTKPVGQGTGLGLSISYGIIQEHGGRVDVASMPGQGSHFIVHLPLRPPTAEP